MSGMSGKKSSVCIREESLELSNNKNLQKGFDATFVLVPTGNRIKELLGGTSEFSLSKGEEKQNVQVLVFESEQDAEFLGKMGAHIIRVEEKENSIQEEVSENSQDRMYTPSLTEKQIEETFEHMNETDKLAFATHYLLEQKVYPVLQSTRIGKWFLEKVGYEIIEEDEEEDIDPIILAAYEKQQAEKMMKQKKLDRKAERKAKIVSKLVNLPGVHAVLAKFGYAMFEDQKVHHNNIVELHSHKHVQDAEQNRPKVTDFNEFKKKKEQPKYNLEQTISKASKKPDVLKVEVDPDTIGGLKDFMIQYADRMYNLIEK